MTIVLIAHGKGNDYPHNFAVRLFSNKEEALEYIERINKPNEKYWTVAEIVKEGKAVEPMREGFSSSFSNDFVE